MKNLRTFSTALVLTLVFAAPAFAGIIECGIAPPPPPPDPVTEIALSLFQSLLAQF